MKYKVFCSLPMKDIPWPEIEHNLFCMKQQFMVVAESKYGFSPDDEFEFVDNLRSSVPMNNILHEPIWYLHKALEKLSECNMALFHSGWENANGCVVEHAACIRYNIPIYYCFKEGEELIEKARENYKAFSSRTKKRLAREQVHFPARERFEKAIRTAYEDADWLFTGLAGKMSDEDLENSHDFIDSVINAAVLKMKMEEEDGQA